MTSILPPGRFDSSRQQQQQRSTLQHQNQQQRHAVAHKKRNNNDNNNDNNNNNNNQKHTFKGDKGDGQQLHAYKEAPHKVAVRAAGSRRSLTLSEAIQVAHSVFADGEFQPEVFPRALCLLVEAFEGGDNAVRLCVARLVERFRPYLGCTAFSAEVTQRISVALNHDDPTTRQLALDVLSVLAFAVGGLPPAVLVGVGRSLRSRSLPERQAAARAYASCLCVHRFGEGPTSSSQPFCLPPKSTTLSGETLAEMTAIASALLPRISWDAPGWAPEVVDDERERQSAAKGVVHGERIRIFLDGVLSQLSGDSPSMELWQSIKAFLLSANSSGSKRIFRGTKGPKGCHVAMLALEFILGHLKESASANTADPNHSLSAIAADLTVTLLNAEAASGGPGDVGGAGAATDTSNADSSFTHDDEDAMMMDVDTEFKKSTAHTRGAVQCLLSALGTVKGGGAKHTAEMADVLSIVGSPMVAEAALSAAETAAVGGVGSAAASEAGLDSDDDGVDSDKNANSFALAMKTVEVLVELGRLPSPTRSKSAPVSAHHRVALAATVALVSYAVAAYRKAAPGGGLYPVGPREREALTTMAELATGAVFDCSPVLSLFGVGSGKRNGSAAKDSASIRTAERWGTVENMLEARVVVGQLRALASAPGGPRYKVLLAATKRLTTVDPECPLAVDLAVLASQLMRANVEEGAIGDGGSSANGTGGYSPALLLWNLLFRRRFSRSNPKAAVGIAVALMRAHQGSLSRQATLSSAMVESMGTLYGIGGRSRAASTRSVTYAMEDDFESDRGIPSSTPAFGGDKTRKSAGKGADVGLERTPDSSANRSGDGYPLPRGSSSDAKGKATGEDSSSPSFLQKRTKGDSPDVARDKGLARPDEQGDLVGLSSGEPLIADSWFQLVLCRECMLHGFQRPAEAGLRRLREAVEDGGAGATGDAVWAWTEVLLKISAAEAFYADSTDQVAAHACAAHETRLAAESLSLLPRLGVRRRPYRMTLEDPANGLGTSPNRSHGREDFSFQRRFLEARAELLQLLGASWAMCQDLSAMRNSKFTRFTRREARCRRLPAAFRRLARDFRVLRGLRPGAGPTTTEPLRGASCLCLLLAIAADALLNKGKDVLVGSRDKSGTKKKSWRAWLERLAAGAISPGSGSAGKGISGGAAAGEGVFMRAVRLLGERLLSLGSPPPAAVGRVAFTTILDTVRGIPFPIPRAFFRKGGGPRLSISALPPVPSSANGAADTDAWGAAPPANQQPDQQANGKRPRRDGGAGAEYYGPSSQLRAEISANERLHRQPALPLMSTNRRMDGEGGGRDAWLPSELWWAQFAREEAFSSGAGWRVHASPAPGVWLLQGFVGRGRGAGGELPAVSEVILEVVLQPLTATEGNVSPAPPDGQDSTSNNGKPWTTKVIAEVIGAETDVTTALCFRAEVSLPPINGSRCIDVTVSLRRGRRRSSRRADAGIFSSESGEAALLAEEVWTIGSESIALPFFPAHVLRLGYHGAVEGNR